MQIEGNKGGTACPTGSSLEVKPQFCCFVGVTIKYPWVFTSLKFAEFAIKTSVNYVSRELKLASTVYKFNNNNKKKGVRIDRPTMLGSFALELL